MFRESFPQHFPCRLIGILNLLLFLPLLSGCYFAPNGELTWNFINQPTPYPPNPPYFFTSIETLAYSYSIGVISGIANDNTNSLYFLDQTNSVIYQYNPSTNVTLLVAGTPGVFGSRDGTGLSAYFSSLNSLVFDSSTNLFYIADNNLIRTFDLTTSQVTTVYGQAGISSIFNGTGTSATFSSVNGITIDSSNAFIYLTDTNIVRRITLSSQLVETLAGIISIYDSVDSTDGGGDTASFFSPKDLAYFNSNLYVTDNNNLRLVNASTGDTTTVIQSTSPGFVDGPTSVALLDEPSSLTLDIVDQVLYIADTGNNAIRQLDLGSGIVTTLVGGPSLLGNTNGPLDAAQFYEPTSVFFLTKTGESGLYAGSFSYLKLIH